MTATARHARQGAVTVAAKQAITMAGPCEPGDVLGAIGGDFVVVGHDLTEVAEDVLGRLLGGGGEMVTLVSGADDADGALAETCAGLAGGAAPHCRRRGVRRRPGALPAPGRRRVVERVGAAVIDLDSPVESVLGVRQGQEGPAPATSGIIERLGIRDRRRPAAPLPAPLPRDRLAHRRSRRSRRASCSPWSARSRSSAVKTYQDRRTGRTAYRQEVVLRTEGPSLRMSFFAQNKRIGRVATSGGSPTGAAASSWARPAPSAASGSSPTRRWCCSAPDDEDADGLRGAVARVDRRALPDLPAHQGRRVVGPPEGDQLRADRRRRAARAAARRRSGRSTTCSTPATALDWIHAPDTWGQIKRAQHRYRFEEALVTQLVLGRRRRAVRAMGARPRDGGDGGLLAAFDARLPFELTRGQVEIGAQIEHDLGQPHPMNRLLQGEVGSGKTLVALRAMLRVVDSGRPGRAARAHRGARPAAPPLDHRAARRPGRRRDAGRGRPRSSCSPAR